MKGSLGKTRRRRQDDNTMDPTEVVWITDDFCARTRVMRPRILQNGGGNFSLLSEFKRESAQQLVGWFRLG